MGTVSGTVSGGRGAGAPPQQLAPGSGGRGPRERASQAPAARRYTPQLLTALQGWRLPNLYSPMTQTRHHGDFELETWNFAQLSFIVPFRKSAGGLFSGSKLRTCRDVSLSVLEDVFLDSMFLDRRRRLSPRAMRHRGPVTSRSLQTCSGGLFSLRGSAVQPRMSAMSWVVLQWVLVGVDPESVSRLPSMHDV